MADFGDIVDQNLNALYIHSSLECKFCYSVIINTCGPLFVVRLKISILFINPQSKTSV